MSAPTVPALGADAVEGVERVRDELAKYAVLRRTLSGPPVESVTIAQIPHAVLPVVARLLAEAEQRGREAAAEAVEGLLPPRTENRDVLDTFMATLERATDAARESRAGTGGDSGNGARG